MSNLTLKMKLWAGAALLMLGAGTAQAEVCASYQDAGTTINLYQEDMTLNGVAANDCAGPIGGNINDKTVTDAYFGGGWTYLTAANFNDSGASTPGTGTFGGYTFTLSASGDTAGTWDLTVSPTAGLPITLDFIGALKAGTSYALWFFDDRQIFADNSGTWTIRFLNRGDQIPDLSHLSLLVRDGSTKIPEPASLALVGLALAGIAATRRRRPA